MYTLGSLDLMHITTAYYKPASWKQELDTSAFLIFLPQSDEIDQALSSQYLDYMRMHMIKPKKFRSSLSSLSSAVSQSNEWQPYLQRASTSSSVSSALMS